MQTLIRFCDLKTHLITVPQDAIIAHSLNSKPTVQRDRRDLVANGYLTTVVPHQHWPTGGQARLQQLNLPHLIINELLPGFERDCLLDAVNKAYDPAAAADVINAARANASDLATRARRRQRAEDDAAIAAAENLRQQRLPSSCTKFGDIIKNWQAHAPVTDPAADSIEKARALLTAWAAADGDEFATTARARAARQRKEDRSDAAAIRHQFNRAHIAADRAAALAADTVTDNAAAYKIYCREYTHHYITTTDPP